MIGGERMASESPTRAPRLDLARLIDLELALLRDRDRPLEELLPRDAAIREQIRADALDGRALYLRWLEALPERSQPSTGERAAQLVALIGALLAVLGFVLGASAVVGWLVLESGLPVNVVNFWSILAGAQALFALLWLVAVLPGVRLRALPFAGGMVALLQDLARLLPNAAGWLLAKLPGGSRSALLAELGRLRKLDWLYGGLRFWLLVRASQVFALMFNVGVVAAFVFVPYVNDPAFGWRSRLLDAEALHASVEWVSLPWSPVFPEVSLDLEEIRASQYSSVQQSLERIERRPPVDGDDPWAAWWPFLLASLLCYGLAPRLIFLVVAAFQARRKLVGARLDHAEFLRLRDRLKRRHVETRAPDVDPDGPPPTGGSLEAGAAVDLGAGPLAVFTWCGVGLEEGVLARSVEARFGASPASIRRVGGLDAGEDRVALDLLERSREGAALLVVEAWEPPVADYVDFVASLRRVLGPNRPVVVALCNRGDAGEVLPAAPSQHLHWRRRLAELGDPWLCVESLVREEAA
jgi:hypothetical protein